MKLLKSEVTEMMNQATQDSIRQHHPRADETASFPQLESEADYFQALLRRRCFRYCIIDSF